MTKLWGFLSRLFFFVCFGLFFFKLQQSFWKGLGEAFVLGSWDTSFSNKDAAA